jgi:hypothetical protein
LNSARHLILAARDSAEFHEHRSRGAIAVEPNHAAAVETSGIGGDSGKATVSSAAANQKR